MTTNSSDCSLAVAYLTEHVSGLQGIYLFGSYASGNQTDESDVDLAILAAGKIVSAKLTEISYQLSTLLQIDQVDLVDLKAVNVIFQEEILKTGQRIATLDWRACEIYEDYIYCKAMRFREWRKSWIAEIMARGSIYG